MALVLDATVGGEDSNTYSLLATADTYFESRLYTDTWDDADDADQDKALAQATRLLDQWYTWAGEAASAEQALRWPRIDAYDLDGNLIASDELPANLVYATAELAMALLADDRTADSDVATQGLKRIHTSYISDSLGVAAIWARG